MSDIKITVRLDTPTVPNFLKISSVRHGDLDSAIGAANDSLTVDIADLGDDSLDSVARQWAEALKRNASQRREQRVKAAQSQNAGAP